MPIKILGDGSIEAKGIRVVKIQDRQAKQKKAKAKKEKDKEVRRGPKDCPYATLIEEDGDGRGLYECSMRLYHSGSGTLEEEWEPVRLREGAELCVDCDRRPCIIEEQIKKGGKKKND